MLCEPVESVTVMFAPGRSRITVSFDPAVGPLPAAPGIAPPAAGRHERRSCPGICGGAMGVCPLFQFASVLQSPLELFIHTAGMSWSFTHSISPRETSTSVFDVLLLLPLSFIVLAYCQNCHGCVVP